MKEIEVFGISPENPREICSMQKPRVDFRKRKFQEPKIPDRKNWNEEKSSSGAGCGSEAIF